jgi:uncharacterized protein YaaW (UPF0174 family)
VAPGPVRLSLGGVEVRYRSNGTDYRRAIAATTTVCITRLSHCRRR